MRTERPSYRKSGQRYRIAEISDIPEIAELIAISARGLREGYYTPEQVEGALGTVFGVDSQLIKDQTYFVAVHESRIVGCGGWSRRKTPYGGDAARRGQDALRDPTHEPAMIRAFFVHPDFARQGIGRELLRRSEAAARMAGFNQIEIVATLPGEPLYASCGYAALERFDIALPNGASLPVVRMRLRNESCQPPQPKPHS